PTPSLHSFPTRRSSDLFEGLIDLISMKAHYYEDDLGTRSVAKDIPEDYKEKAEELHASLVEAVAELDEDLMMKYLEGEEISEEEDRKSTRLNSSHVSIS